jgi:hypothetical protein
MGQDSAPGQTDRCSDAADYYFELLTRSEGNYGLNITHRVPAASIERWGAMTIPSECVEGEDEGTETCEQSVGGVAFKIYEATN